MKASPSLAVPHIPGAFPLGLPRPRSESRGRDAVLMLLAALAIRCWWFGNPVVQVDEQFYLLVGDRMLHGALPYVDIWDRKPIGLFLIYAATRLLGGGGVIEYQLVATLFAAVMAFLVVRLARMRTGSVGAWTAGLVALLWLDIFDGAGGQAPVLYNPLVAAAALVTLHAAIASPRRLPALGAAAMALIGVAIQIKYTVIFEGVGFGCALLFLAWRARIAPARIAAVAALWIGIALAPTLLAYGIYGALGHGRAFAFANFVSIGQRLPTSPQLLIDRLGTILSYAAPLLVAAIAGIARPDATWESEQARRLQILWLVAAGIGFCAIGSLYKHYFLPAVVPLAVAAAPTFDRVMRWRGLPFRPWGIAVLLLGVGLAGYTGVGRLHARGDGREVEAMTAAIRPRLAGCLYVFDGEPILYRLTGACVASPYAFPSHLNERREGPAIGVDQAAEVRRILATRPSVIVTSDRPARDGNPATWALMRERLRQDYRPVAAVRVHHRLRLIYALRPPQEPLRNAALPVAGTRS